MKNMTFILIFLFSFQIYAQNRSAIELQAGKTISVDVADQSKDLLIEWSIFSQNAFVKPKVKVLQVDGDFSCIVDRTMTLISSRLITPFGWKQVWNIKVHWEPGADLSGCLIQLTHPNEQDVKLKLYMNY